MTMEAGTHTSMYSGVYAYATDIHALPVVTDICIHVCVMCNTHMFILQMRRSIRIWGRAPYFLYIPMWGRVTALESSLSPRWPGNPFYFSVHLIFVVHLHKIKKDKLTLPMVDASSVRAIIVRDVIASKTACPRGVVYLLQLSVPRAQ